MFAVKKPEWEQLFDVVLRSYPSGDEGDPDAYQHYTQWKSLGIGPERNTAMRTAFYRLSVNNPAAVQWYCSLKLELALHLILDVITRQLRSGVVPGLQQTTERVRRVLAEKLGKPIDVDDLSELKSELRRSQLQTAASPDPRA